MSLYEFNKNGDEYLNQFHLNSFVRRVFDFEKTKRLQFIRPHYFRYNCAFQVTRRTDEILDLHRYAYNRKSFRKYIPSCFQNTHNRNLLNQNRLRIVDLRFRDRICEFSYDIHQRVSHTRLKTLVPWFFISFG